VGKEEEVTLMACAMGNIGRAWVNKTENPTCAIAVAADFCYLLGSSDGIEEEEFIGQLNENCRGKIIVSEDNSFDSKIEKSFNDKFHKFSRYKVKGEINLFDKRQLNDFISNIEPEFQVKRIDESLYYKVLEEEWTADFCSNFNSVDEYLKHGIGYVIIKNGKIIAGASSYSYCRGKIEISIETKEQYRRKGLAVACASKLILESIERDIYPRWDAANLESVALAEKLGYHFEKEYIVYSLK
jgi:GNAT superfamily N-acetyltransferase